MDEECCYHTLDVVILQGPPGEAANTGATGAPGQSIVGPTGAQGPPGSGSILVNATYFVDAEYGDDETGTPDDMSLPYATVPEVPSGSSVIFRAGQYIIPPGHFQGVVYIYGDSLDAVLTTTIPGEEDSELFFSNLTLHSEDVIVLQHRTLLKDCYIDSPILVTTEESVFFEDCVLIIEDEEESCIQGEDSSTLLFTDCRVVVSGLVPVVHNASFKGGSLSAEATLSAGNAPVILECLFDDTTIEEVSSLSDLLETACISSSRFYNCDIRNVEVNAPEDDYVGGTCFLSSELNGCVVTNAQAGNGDGQVNVDGIITGNRGGDVFAECTLTNTRVVNAYGGEGTDVVYLEGLLPHVGGLGGSILRNCTTTHTSLENSQGGMGGSGFIPGGPALATLVAGSGGDIVVGGEHSFLNVSFSVAGHGGIQNNVAQALPGSAGGVGGALVNRSVVKSLTLGDASTGNGGDGYNGGIGGAFMVSDLSDNFYLNEFTATTITTGTAGAGFVNNSIPGGTFAFATRISNGFIMELNLGEGEIPGAFEVTSVVRNIDVQTLNVGETTTATVSDLLINGNLTRLTITTVNKESVETDVGQPLSAFYTIFPGMDSPVNPSFQYNIV